MPASPKAAPAASSAATRLELSSLRSVHCNSGTLHDPLLAAIDGPCTFMQAIRLEDEPASIRIAFANDIALAYPISAVSACVSTSMGDGINPNGGAPWSQLTAHPFTVSGNGGGPRIPALVWTPWAPIRSIAPEDGSGRPILFLRVSTPAWTAPRCCNGALGFSQTKVAQGREILSFLRSGADLAASPSANVQGAQAYDANPVYCVQYRSRTGGATLLWSGDSHYTGATTPGNIDAFALQSCLRVSTPARPLSPANYAWGGSGSTIFLPVLEHMMEACRPQILLLEGWTPNDGPSEEAATAYCNKMLDLAARAGAMGAVPILLTRFPHVSLLHNAQEAAIAERLRRRQLAMAGPALTVIDATSVLEEPDRPGAYRPGLSKDGIHPNAAGHEAVAALLTPVLQRLLL